MPCSLVPLTKQLQKTPFDCGNPVLNEYFRQYSLKNDKLLLGKTFVALQDDTTVAGYMTLSNAQIEAAALANAIRVRLPKYPVPALRIGKLAVDIQFQGRGIGAYLLRSALEKALSVSNTTGLFAVLVDAIDEKAKGFYVKYGFLALPDRPWTLFLPLATILKACTLL
jgi:ribosomal protein S18 acetylase RimI-like enzyme